MVMNAEERFQHQKWLKSNDKLKTNEEIIADKNKEIETLTLENRLLKKSIENHEGTHNDLWETIRLYVTKERKEGVTLDSVMKHIGWRR